MIGHMVWLYADKDLGTMTPPTGTNLLANPGFESGAVGWTGTSGPITDNSGRPARTGSWKAWLGGNGTTSSESISQQVTIPAAATTASLSYWIRTDTAELGSTVYDTLEVQVVRGGTATTLRTFSNVGTDATYAQVSHSLLAWRGQTVTVRLLMNEDSSLQTSFVVDDTAVTTS
jgi:aminopeptidase S